MCLSDKIEFSAQNQWNFDEKGFFTWFAVLYILLDKKYSNFILPLVSEQYNNAPQWSESL